VLAMREAGVAIGHGTQAEVVLAGEQQRSAQLALPTQLFVGARGQELGLDGQGTAPIVEPGFEPGTRARLTLDREDEAAPRGILVEARELAPDTLGRGRDLHRGLNLLFEHERLVTLSRV